MAQGAEASNSTAAEVSERGFAIIPDALDANEVSRSIEVLERLIHEDLANPDPRRRSRRRATRR